MSNSLTPSARKVQEALLRHGLEHQVVELPQTTRTAKEAAQAIGCTVAQIAKSLIFRGSESGQPVLAIVSGANRVDEARLADHLGEPVEKPDADYVLRQTGYVIGGVAPLGHSKPLRTFIDEDLFLYEQIWAAAGNPNAVFPLTPADLLAVSGGEVVRIKS